MQETYSQTKKLFYKHLRVSKEDSAYIYFMLESREGLCFYSTVEESIGLGHRDLIIRGTIELKESFEQFITYLNKEIEIITIEDKIILDL
jgi:hypothetical protein